MAVEYLYVDKFSQCIIIKMNCVPGGATPELK